MTVTTTRPPAWLAGRDRVSHAHRRPRDVRAICGEPAVRERDAWPPLRKCLACSQLVAQESKSPR